MADTKFKKGLIPWNKGIKLPYKVWNEGKKFSKEYRERLSKAHIGQPSWSKGKKLSKEHCKNISLARLGKRYSPKTEFKKGNISWMKGKTGEKSPCWKGGKSFEPYTPDFNKSLKDMIINRDMSKCQLCGRPQQEEIRRLTVHHIDYNKNNNSPINLITLCCSCNSIVNNKREYFTQYFRERIGVIYS